MRLTPSWLRSSSGGSTGKKPEQPDTKSGVTIYHTPSSGITETESPSEQRATYFLPDTDAALLAALDELSTPVTVDEIADQLIQPARPPVETWATVHERLHQDRLPALEETGAIVFDESQGIVERRQPPTQSEAIAAAPVSRTLPIDPLLAVLVLLSASLLSIVLLFVLSFGV